MDFHLINSDSFGFSEQNNRIFFATNCIALLVYFALAAWTGYNIKAYIVDQKRYKTFSVLIFYVLAVVIELFRMMENIGQMCVELQVPRPAFSHTYVYNACYVICAYAKIVMGYYQVASMSELAVRVGFYQNPDRIVRIIYIATNMVNVTVVVVGGCMTYLIVYEEVRVVNSCPPDTTDLY